MYYRNRFFHPDSHEELGEAMSPEDMRYPAAGVGDDDALVYTVHDLTEQAVCIMSEIEKTGRPAFITSYGRFVAVIAPLAPGQVESRVLAEMAREIAKGAGCRPSAVVSERPHWSPALSIRP